MELTKEQQEVKDKWIAGRQPKSRREVIRVDMAKAFPGQLVEGFGEEKRRGKAREEDKC